MYISTFEMPKPVTDINVLLMTTWQYKYVLQLLLSTGCIYSEECWTRGL